MLNELKQRRISLPFQLLVVIIFLLSGGGVPSTFASDLGLSADDCRCCHGTTLADRHHLLVNTSGRECLSCHPLTFNEGTQSYDLTVTRDCLLCHTGSLADRHHLLVDQVNYNCFTCHALTWDPLTLQYVTDFNNACQSSTPPEPVGTITGNVTDQAGAGLGWVRIATADGTYSTLATATGSYELPGLAPGSYTLSATLNGYVGASKSVTITDGQILAVDFVLSPLPVPATISGVIRDVNQTPMEGVSIASVNGIYSTLSTVDGSYTLGNVAEGSLNLIAHKPGYIEVSQTANVSAGQDLTLDFILPAAVEICTDGLDNNGNGLSDCDDSACFGIGSCQTPATEICDDGLDNDGNGLTDCNDLICFNAESCESPVVEICNDNTDNNGDGLLDCDDPLCSTAIYCLTEHCDDGIDNNDDGLIDCSDPDCTETSLCLSPPVEICGDGLDNDNNGLLDCDDTKCRDLDTCFPPVADEFCKNGIDDDGDGDIDCADAQCQNRAVCQDEICDNALDDDSDERVDCEDRECRNTTACSTYTGGHSLNFSVTASRERPKFKASNISDKDMSTRWMAGSKRKQWLKLDLGGIYPIDKVDIHWHNRYADIYKIKVSKNGRYWKKVKAVKNGDGGLDSNTFKSRDARFVLIKLKNAASIGYSIYEVEVFRSAD